LIGFRQAEKKQCRCHKRIRKGFHSPLLFKEGWLRPVRKCCEATSLGADGVVGLTTPPALFHTFAIPSPALSQTSIKPIPKHVENEFSRSTRPIVCRSPHSKVRQNMLAFAERHLKLRHQIPICFRAGFEISVSQELHHWRPDPAKAM